MFCPNCGTQNVDGVRFCRLCGKPLQTRVQPQAQSAQPVQPAQPQPSYSQPAQPQPSYSQGAQQPYTPPVQPNAPQQPYVAPVPPVQPYIPPVAQPDSALLAAIKSFFSSPLFLAAAIITSVAFALSLVSGSFTSTVSDGYTSNYTSTVNYSISVVGPSLFTLIGYWLVYTSAKKPIGFSTTGFTLFKVSAIIQLVLICIAGAVAASVAVCIIIGATTYLGARALGAFGSQLSALEALGLSLSAIASILIVILIAVVVVMIVHYSKLIKGLNVVKGSINTGFADNRIPLFPAVIYFISCLSNLGTILGANSSGIARIAAAAAIAAAVFNGVLILKYRTMMNEIVAAAQPVPAAAFNAPYSQPTEPTYGAPAAPTAAEPTYAEPAAPAAPTEPTCTEPAAPAAPTEPTCTEPTAPNDGNTPQ